MEPSIAFSKNADLPAAVRSVLADDHMQSVFRVTYNAHVRDGRGELVASLKAYRAIEDLGYEQDQAGKWISKGLTVSDVHVDGPLGSDDEDVEKNVGGKVIDVVEESSDKAWVNVIDVNGSECAVFCSPSGEEIKPGDSLWWQSGTCYWTPQDRSRVDVELPKIGYSGVSRPVNKEDAAEDTTCYFMPPIEVHQAAKRASDQGAVVADITGPLAAGRGLAEVEIRKIDERFRSEEAASMTDTDRDSWGGARAAKWASRVIRKLEAEKTHRAAADEAVEKAGGGVLLAFWLPPDVAGKLAVPGGEAADDLHVTLAYFGKLDTIDMLALPAIERTVAHFANTHGPLRATLSGLGRFPATPNSEGRDVAYLGVHSSEIQKFRADLIAALEGAGCTAKNDFGYNPHVTLKYVSAHAPHLLKVPECTEVVFDSITLRIGGAPKVYPLRPSVEFAGTVVKLDQAQRLAFGWFSIVEIDGRSVLDTQDDQIPIATLEDGAYEFVLNARKGGEMHEKANGEVVGVARLIESVVFTREKQAAMRQSLRDQGIPADLDLKCTCWWGGMKIDDADTWSKVSVGELRAWSIGGRGRRVEV